MFRTEAFTTTTLANTPLIPILAVLGLVLFVLTWVLWRRAGGRRPRAAITCGLLSLAVHIALFLLVPEKQQYGKGSGEAAGMVDGNAPVMVTISDLETFEPDQPASEQPDQNAFAPPLEVVAQEQPIEPAVVSVPNTSALENLPEIAAPDLTESPEIESVASSAIDELLSDMLLASEAAAAPVASAMPLPTQAATPMEVPRTLPSPAQTASASRNTTQARTVATQVAAERPDDFANRKGLAKRSALIATGGSERTEAAVAAGLRFLAAQQQRDGTWDPITTGAGQERATLGHNRGGAGKRAVTGITGLAVLSLLGNGHTHLDGPYADNVARGLQALLNRQSSDGSLGGPAGTYARMYCHGIATLTLSEAYAMSQDARLATATANSLSYSARIQHPVTGGWRYQPGDTGDLSQFGWQAMAIQSGKQGGLTFDRRIDDRLKTFLGTVRAGRGGLASYRPGKAPSRTMTAEALASRLLLGHDVPAHEIAEAEAYILEEPPGFGADNFYYWYYASLALHQLQSPAWQRWNEAMKRRLLAIQQADGSWPAQTVWGGYGGKAYTTAMGCLCLEVYYRHLSLHQMPEKIAEGRAGNQWTPDQLR